MIKTRCTCTWYISLYEIDNLTLKIPFYIPYVHCIKLRISDLPKYKLTCPSILWFQKFKFQHKKIRIKLNEIYFITHFNTSTENVRVKSSFRSQELILSLWTRLCDCYACTSTCKSEEKSLHFLKYFQVTSVVVC